MLALALPALVFLFLKFFGKNQFEVEPLFASGVDGVPADCPYHETEKPYRIPEQVLQSLQWTSTDSLTLYYFGAVNGANPFTRITADFTLEKTRLWTVFPIEKETDVSIASDQLIYVSRDKSEQWKKCFLFLKEPNDLVLVDHQRRIRGYYISENREDLDRLLTEIAIILKNY